MSRTSFRNFDEPDESLVFDHGWVDWVVIADQTIGRTIQGRAGDGGRKPADVVGVTGARVGTSGPSSRVGCMSSRTTGTSSTSVPTTWSTSRPDTMRGSWATNRSWPWNGAEFGDGSSRWNRSASASSPRWSSPTSWTRRAREPPRWEQVERSAGATQRADAGDRRDVPGSRDRNDG